MPDVPATKRTARRRILLLSAVWALGVGVGFAGLTRYAATPGSPGESVSSWPGNGGVERDPRLATIVLALHPQCPCSRATMDEFERLMAICQGQAAAHVFFYRPSGAPAGWENTDLWRSAARIPGVRLHSDEGGAKARRFGAATSGHVLLFGSDGRTLFSGGITNARGHAGESIGAAAIRSLLSGEADRRIDTPTYGCPLGADDDDHHEGTAS